MNAKNEIWKPVSGYDDIYEVSSMGRFRRVKGGRGATRGRILHPTADRKGYLVIGLSCNVMIASKLPKMIGTKLPTLDRVAPRTEDGLVNPTRPRGAAARASSGDTVHDQRAISQRDFHQ